MDNQSNVEDKTPAKDAPFPAKFVCNWTANKSTHESTNGQLKRLEMETRVEQTTYERNDQTRSNIAKVISTTIVVSLPKPLLKVLHAQETRDLSSVISKNESAHRDKDSHDERMDGQSRHW